MKPATRHVLAAVAAVVMMGASASRASAQVRATALGFAATARNTILFQNSEEHSSGTWTGVEIALRLGRLHLTGLGMSGTLVGAGANPAILDRDGGEMSGSVRVFVTSWLGLGGGYATRRYTSAAGVQDWTIPSAGATLNVPLGTPNLLASISGEYLLSTEVTGTPSPDLGLAADVSLNIALARLPFAFKIQYRIERFDFPTASGGRVEQFERFVISGGFRVGG